ncbi:MULTISPECIES: MFS transporter [Mesorhizobium]|uniref:MFS transporter n=1 Tax=Mesorhizobium denitrificans TaxID=2294114 RepID=A0A371XFB4_9HYPH|nr:MULTISPECIES: MFS transporter [Mesorhizobium]RFC67714.1 MFS transporter [Mesorhizobium denitrificans]
MNTAQNLATAQRGRWAVAGLFFLNGFLVGSWAPQIPELATRLAIRESTLGILILVFGLGAMSFMPLSGVLMSRYGSRRVGLGFACACVFALLAVVSAPNVPLVAIAMFFFGGVVGAMDVAMNSNAVAVEKKLSRAIMSSSHGFWSLGGFVGGGLGGLIIQNFGAFAHAVSVTIALAIMLVLAARYVIDDKHPEASKQKKPMRLPRIASVYLVGAVALFAMIPEGAILDWGALYLRNELGVSIATAGLGFALFAGAMAVLRFVGDRVRNRFGAVQTMRISCLIAAAGIFVAGLSPWAWLVIASFAVAGVGIANIVPIAFSAAGNQPGISASTGMSVVTTIGYSGILLAPSAIGFAAEHVGFSWVYIALSVPLIVVCACAELVRAADFQPDRQIAGPEMI